MADYGDKPKRRRLKNMRLDRVDLVTAGANPGATVMIHKFDAPDIVEVEMAEAEIVETPEVPVEKDENDVSDQVETVAKADFDVMAKNLESEVAKAAALEERIAKMEHERKQSEFVAKARELSNLGSAAELGGMLLEASEGLSSDNFQLLERTLKAANAQVEKGALFAQMGKQDGEALDVVDRITELAKAKVEAGEAKTLQIAKLMVIGEHPELQSEYMSARSAL